MKKIGFLVKEFSENRLKSVIEEASTLFVISYPKLSGLDIGTLRLMLKAHKAGLLVVKNSVAKRALKDSQLQDFFTQTPGPCGVVFTTEDPVIVSKTLCDFAKDHESLQLQGGILQNRFLNKADIVAISRLPSKEILRAQMVMTLQSPIRGLAITCNQLLTKLVRCFDQIKKKKEP